jgi:hypothetical protein
VVVASQSTSSCTVVVTGETGRVVVTGKTTSVGRVVGGVGVESVGSLSLSRGVGHGTGGQRHVRMGQEYE